jgi:hypothetical protein
MVAYTQFNVTGPVKFDNGGYHQITLGIDCFVNQQYECNCPAIN